MKRQKSPPRSLDAASNRQHALGRLAQHLANPLDHRPGTVAATATPSVPRAPFPTPTPDPPAECRFADGTVLSVSIQQSGPPPAPGAVPTYDQGSPGLTSVAVGEPEPGIKLELRMPGSSFVAGAEPVGPLFASMQARVAGGGVGFYDPRRVTGGTWAGYWSSDLVRNSSQLDLTVWVGGTNYPTATVKLTVAL